MRGSLLLAVAAWALYVAAQTLMNQPAVVAIALLAAGAFTLLLAAHLVAYFLRAARLWRAGAFPEGPPASAEPGPNRRSFLIASSTVLAGVLFVPLSRLMSLSAVAQQSGPHVNCQEGPGWSVNLTSPPIIGCGKETGDLTAGQVALKDFLSKVEKACANAEPKEAKKGVCQQRKCKNVEKKCVVHTPTGTDFKKDELELRAIAPGDACAPGDTNVLFVPKKKGKDVLFKCNCDCA